MPPAVIACEVGCRRLCGKKERKVFARPSRSICFCGVEGVCVLILHLGVEIAVGFVHAEIEDLHKGVAARPDKESVLCEWLQAIYVMIVYRISICGLV